jgi:adenylate cyclase class 2
MNGQETEVKFYVGNLNKIGSKLLELGAVLIQPRVHETNLRFDTPDLSLRREGKVLRLRQDGSAKMTFKSDTTETGGILSRREIEFEVGSFEAARELVEALGYEVMAFYEKYRRIYELNQTHIMLDELPYGDFVEIEGNDLESIQKTAKQLKLNIEKAVTTSYHKLFEKIAETKSLDKSSLNFSIFENGKPKGQELGVEKAD